MLQDIKKATQAHCRSNGVNPKKIIATKKYVDTLVADLNKKKQEQYERDMEISCFPHLIPKPKLFKWDGEPGLYVYGLGIIIDNDLNTDFKVV